MGGPVEPLSGPGLQQVGLQRVWSYVTGLNTGKLLYCFSKLHG